MRHRQDLGILLAAALAALGCAHGALAQTITEFDVPTVNSKPQDMVAGPDGALWFTEFSGNKIGRITTAGAITEFAVPTAASGVFSMTVGPDGNLWFTQVNVNKIGRITPAGIITEFPAPGAPGGITVGPDGALWFTEIADNKIGRMTTSGTITAEFPFLTAGAVPHRLKSGPDGNLWVTLAGVDKIARVTTAGVVTEFPTLTPGGAPFDIVTGPDGNLWFTQIKTNKVGRITPAGVVTEFPAGNPSALITVGPDGALWFSESNTEFVVNDNKIGRITTAGVFQDFAPPSADSQPQGIATGADGAMWFTEYKTNKIGRLATKGLLVPSAANMVTAGNAGGPFVPASVSYLLKSTSDTTNYAITGLPSWLSVSAATGTVDRTGTTITFTVNASAAGLAPGTYGPDTITFANTTNGFGSTTRQAVLTVGNFGATSVVSAVLPASRSVQVGSAATAFATIINTGSARGINCELLPGSTIAAAFGYQTTDAHTNAVTGSANTPVHIDAGAAQSFVFAFTPSAPFAPTDVKVTAHCANAPAAPSVTGLNTLLLAASATPVPDIVALAATASNDGIVHLLAPSNNGAFAVATVNVGAAATIAVSADTGAATLPLQLSLCETNPANGQCTSAVGASVVTTIATNATPTFAVFAHANASVAFDPANSRIFVRFKDSGGVTRGSTSVAVRTQ